MYRATGAGFRLASSPPVAVVAPSGLLGLAPRTSAFEDGREGLIADKSVAPSASVTDGKDRVSC